MTTREQAQATVDGYLAAYNADDPDALVALFTDDAVFIDPVGTPAHVGPAAIRAFWDAVHELSPHIELRPEMITICGNEVALVMEIHAGGLILDAVDIFDLDGTGRIVGLKAYWDMDRARTPAPEPEPPGA